MKNVLLILNILLLGLVGYLYFLHFSSDKATTSQNMPSINNSDSLQEKAKIAYIDLDSLQSHYAYYEKVKSDLDKKQSSAKERITQLQTKYQSRAAQLQQNANTMTPKEQENAMNEINKMQKDFQVKQQELDNELYNYNAKVKEDILSRIEDFLKEYNKDGRYSYIFSYEPGFMFYKDSALNITQDVIVGLNKRYKEELGKENKK